MQNTPFTPWRHPEIGRRSRRFHSPRRWRGGVLLRGPAFSCPAPLPQATGGCPLPHPWVGVGWPPSRRSPALLLTGHGTLSRMVCLAGSFLCRPGLWAASYHRSSRLCSSGHSTSPSSCGGSTRAQALHTCSQPHLGFLYAVDRVCPWLWALALPAVTFFPPPWSTPPSSEAARHLGSPLVPSLWLCRCPFGRGIPSWPGPITLTKCHGSR